MQEVTQRKPWEINFRRHTAELGNTIKVRQKEKYEVLHDVLLVVLQFWHM